MTHGAFLLDKDPGLSSNAALQQAKRAFGAAKAGHAGTLDPLASGLLVVLFGEATKFATPLLEDDKEYLATVKLGEKTATADAEGPVTETGPTSVPAEAIEPALTRFRGPIAQIPPMYSALKREGVPLYELARRGETVERAPRAVRITALRARRYEPPFLDLQVACSKGTYVRTLVEDIAVALGTVGHLTALRRTRSGTFRIEGASRLEDVLAEPEAARMKRVLPLASLLQGLPRVELAREAAARFRQGQAIPVGGVQGICGVFGPSGDVIGLGRAAEATLRPIRLTATQEAESPAKTL